MENPERIGIKFANGKLYLWNGTTWQEWPVQIDTVPTPSSGFKQIVGDFVGLNEYNNLNSTYISYASESNPSPTITSFARITQYYSSSGESYGGTIKFKSGNINIKGVKRIKVINAADKIQVWQGSTQVDTSWNRCSISAKLVGDITVDLSASDYTNIPTSMNSDTAYIEVNFWHGGAVTGYYKALRIVGNFGVKDVFIEYGTRS